MYSTSANKHKYEFDKDFAVNNSDIIIFNKEEFLDNNSSSIYKISKNKIKKLR
jgi:hypothetical protein